MKRSGSLTRRVNLLFLASLVGVGAAIAWLAFRQYGTLIQSNQAAIAEQADLIYQAVKNAMLPGQAPIAVSIIRDIKQIRSGLEIRLIRANGVEAFSDNATIRTVNANRVRAGLSLFAERGVPPAPRLVPPENRVFARSVQERREIQQLEVMDGETYLAIYQPLINLPKCTGCHGSDHVVRGVIYVARDITRFGRQSRREVAVAGGLLLAVVAVLSLLLTLFLHRRVIGPVKHIGEVCTQVTGGNFEARVRVSNRDEIGDLAGTVNRMVEGLYERFRLAKYVSHDTIRAIREGEGAARAVLTVLFSDIRGFTAYSERQPPDRVVHYLNRLLSVQTEIVDRHGGDVDKYVGDQVMARFTGEAGPLEACAAALEIQREISGADGGRYSGLQVGIGINTGEVILGMIGSERRADRTVIGDPVNLAARLCGAARPGRIVVSEGTAREVRGRAVLKGPFRLAVKGKAGVQRVYLLEGLTEVTE